MTISFFIVLSEVVVKGNIARLTVLNLRVCFNVDDDGEIKKGQRECVQGRNGIYISKVKGHSICFRKILFAILRCFVC